jgi:phage/plasmid-associated DNA primase
MGVLKVSKKLVLNFFQLHNVDCYKPKELYNFYVDWAKRRRRRRVSFSQFSFLLFKYLEEQKSKKLKLGDFR